MKIASVLSGSSALTCWVLGPCLLTHRLTNRHLTDDTVRLIDLTLLRHGDTLLLSGRIHGGGTGGNRSKGKVKGQRAHLKHAKAKKHYSEKEWVNKHATRTRRGVVAGVVESEGGGESSSSPEKTALQALHAAGGGGLLAQMEGLQKERMKARSGPIAARGIKYSFDYSSMTANGYKVLQDGVSTFEVPDFFDNYECSAPSSCVDLLPS